MATELYAEFAITGENLDPSAITRLLGITPDRAYRRGDPITQCPGSALRKEGAWSIRTATTIDCTAELNDHLTALLSKLHPVRNLLAELIDHFSFGFCCVLYMDQEIPALYVARNVLQAMSDMHASFDTDAYRIGAGASE